MVKPKILKLTKGGKLADANNIGENLIVIGKILKTVGLKGMLKVNMLTDFPERFAPGEVATVRRKDGSLEDWKIIQKRDHFTGTRVDILFDGISNRDEAADLVSCFLVIEKSERIELPEGSFYSDELEGMAVFSGGVNVGNVLTLESDVPSPYIDIDAGDLGEVMIPFRKQFLEINKAERKVVLKQDISVHMPG